MSLTRCPYCVHGNPADAKFCSACGGALHLPPYLASCPRCGTVNPVKATECCWCRGQLSGRRSLRRRPSRVITATAVLAAIAVLGYYTYHQGSLADTPQRPAASSEGGGREAPPDPGVIGRDVAAGDMESEADKGARLTSPATSPSGTPAKAVAITRPQAISAVKARERVQFRPEACTDASAALGLCTTKPVPKKEAIGARKAGGQEPPCTEAVAALGLCALNTNQKRRE